MPYQDTIEKLYPGRYYHIYNRGNNKEIIFKETENYLYFLRLWKKHIQPIAETFCYNLLPNHFHFFIRIREQKSFPEDLKTKSPEQSFANLFNAYAKAINKKYNRTGSLFQERFRRKEITNSSYYTSIIGYIIANAVKHSYSLSTENYPHSAYDSLLSDKPTYLLREEVINWFGNKDIFINYIRNYESSIQVDKKYLFEKEDDE